MEGKDFKEGREGFKGRKGEDMQKRTEGSKEGKEN